MSQRTSSVKPVSDGLAKQIGRMVENAARHYAGGIAKLELVKDDPDFVLEVHKFFDARAADRAQTLPIADRPPWKTIQLGTHQSIKELRQALIEGRFRVSPSANDILETIIVAQEPTAVELACVTVGELGFPDGATRAEIYNKALSLGLDLCPAEVGPQLCLQYLDQPHDYWFFVAMEPIAGSDRSLCIFEVEHVYDGRWLRGCYGRSEDFWFGDHRWVFSRK